MKIKIWTMQICLSFLPLYIHVRVWFSTSPWTEKSRRWLLLSLTLKILINILQSCLGTTGIRFSPWCLNHFKIGRYHIPHNSWAALGILVRAKANKCLSCRTTWSRFQLYQVDRPSLCRDKWALSYDNTIHVPRHKCLCFCSIALSHFSKIANYILEAQQIVHCTTDSGT